MTAAVTGASRNARRKTADCLRMARPSINVARAIAAALLGGPIVAGLALTVLPSFGYLPALGGESFGFAPWRRLFAEPGLAASVRLSVGVGLGSSAMALALALAFVARIAGRRSHGALDGVLAPLLASPHSAVAIGLAFLGWLIRLISPWATGFETPPDVATVGDPFGLALTLGLAVKETPFLIAVGLAALRQFPAQAQMRAARTLGYAPATAFFVVVMPQLYARIRIPVYAVLAYGLTVVDMAIVLAPSRPPPVSMLGLSWFLSPNLDDVFVASAAATLQLGVVAASLLLWGATEALFWYVIVARARRGTRSRLFEPAVRGLALAAWALIGFGFAGLVVLALWAFAWRWPFPLAWPASFTFDVVRRATPQLVRPLGATVALAVLSTTAALALAIGCLEGDDRVGRRANHVPFYLPLPPAALLSVRSRDAVFGPAGRRVLSRRRLGAHAVRLSLRPLDARRTLGGTRSALRPRGPGARRARVRDPSPREASNPRGPPGRSPSRSGFRSPRRSIFRPCSPAAGGSRR